MATEDELERLIAQRRAEGQAEREDESRRREKAKERELRHLGYVQTFNRQIGSIIGSVIAARNLRLRGVGELFRQSGDGGGCTITYSKMTGGGGAKGVALRLSPDEDGNVIVTCDLLSGQRPSIPLAEVTPQVLDGLLRDFLMEALKA